MLALITAASAEIEEQKVGPYVVSFDLTNSSLKLNDSSIKWGNPFSNEDTSYSEGSIYLVLKNRPDIMLLRLQ